MKKDKQPGIPFTGYQKFVVAMLALLQFTIVLDFMVLSPLGDILMKSLDITPSQFGLVVSSYAFSAGISGILAAGFADKYDRKKLLLFFYTGFIAGTFFCAMANSYWMLLLARTVTGLFGGVIGAVSMAIITDLFDIRQRGRVIGIVQMGLAVSQVLGIPVGLYFANLWGWHSSFLMIVFLSILIGVALLIRLKPVSDHLAVQTDKSPVLHLLHTLGNKEYQVGYLATAFLSIGGFMLMPFGSAYVINNLGLTQEDLPLIFMLSGLASIITMPIIGRLADRVDRYKLFLAGSLLALVMILIYTTLPKVPLWQVVVVNMIMFVGIMSRMIPAISLTTGLPGLRDRGAFMSVNGSLQQMAGGFAAVSAGLIVSQPGKGAPLLHYNRLGWVVCTVIVICAWLVYRVDRLVKARVVIANTEASEVSS
ncbi:MAG: MFS transporter [Gemmatimonadaceae bacterium]|nr:MFS transporter [Chitinophagaceae bacterium]